MLKKYVPISYGKFNNLPPSLPIPLCNYLMFLLFFGCISVCLVFSSALQTRLCSFSIIKVSIDQTGILMSHGETDPQMKLHPAGCFGYASCAMQASGLHYMSSGPKG